LLFLQANQYQLKKQFYDKKRKKIYSIFPQ
jgi:hypothetical protein